MPQVTITHSDGSTETIDQTVGWTDKREIGNTRKLAIDISRDDASAVSLTPKGDEITLAGVTTGRLTDITKQGSAWRLIVRSFEWDAKRVEPLAGGTLKEGDDNTIITDLINDVPNWSVGSIATLTGPMSFVFNHAHRHEALRRVERNVPGELKFNADKSVDYVDSRGSDKSASITLSPSSANVEGDLRVETINRDMDSTHMRIIGAHEGEAQIYANLVPSSDGATYDNRVNYSQPRWSSAADTDWGRWENKDVSDQATIEEEAASLGDELTDTLVEAKATVVGEDLALGDTVHVTKSSADIDRDMRVHRIKTVSKGATVKDKVLLSTRTVARSEEANRLRDIQRFNVAFQGSSVAINGGPVIDAVDSGDPLSIPLRYPDLEFENNAELFVRGMEYRIDSVGAASGGDHTHNIPINVTSNAQSDSDVVEEAARNSTDTTIGETSYTNIATFTPSISCERLNVNLDHTSLSSSNTLGLLIRLRDETAGEYYPAQNSPVETVVTDTLNDRTTTRIDIPKDVNGNLIVIQAKSTNNSVNTRVGWQWWTDGNHAHLVDDTETSDASGDHTHPPDPGIFSTNDTPSNVDVLINGTTVATNIGSGTFQTVVDIGGELNRNQWNTVEVQSDSLGRIMVNPFIEGYDQIGAGN